MEQSENWGRKNVSKGFISLLLTFFITNLSQQTPRLVECSTTDINPYTKEITISFTLPPKDFIYKDFITVSVTDPNILLSPWHANKQAVAHYDSSFKDAKQIFNENFSISTSAFAKATADKPPTNPTYLYCSYYRHSEKKINHILFPLVFTLNNEKGEENVDTERDITEYNTEHVPVKKQSYINHYISIIIYIVHTIIESLYTDHKKYFGLLIFIITVLITFLYFFKQELETQTKIKELIEVIISFLLLISTIYLFLYLYKISTPFTATITATGSTFYAGFFYTKKSTKLQSRRLRTFCTFMGIFCICAAFIISFKALQCADNQFNLF